MTAAVERLKAYHARLRKAGKLMEAKAVARCIELVKATEKPTDKVGTNVGTM